MASGAPSSRPHVLVVEDHDDSRDLRREILEQHRFHVTATVAARDALDLAHGLKFRAVVTDVSLAGAQEDGVWLLTGYAHRQHNLAQAGFTAVLVKPIDIDELVTVVKGALAGQG